MMRFLKKLSAVMALFGASISANAAVFDFNYIGFAGTISGYFSGNLVGSYVENISDIHIFYNGNELGGGLPFQSYRFDRFTGIDTSTAALVSTDQLLNDFIYTTNTSLIAPNVTYFLMTYSDPSNGYYELRPGFGAAGAIARTWTVVQRAEVPEPPIIALLGLAVLGFAASIRRKV